MLGVALGAVLIPQLSAAQARQDAAGYSGMLDWGLRLTLVLALPCTAALLVFPEPMVATLFQRGAFGADDVVKSAMALRGYGVGLLGLIGVKILAPGFYARQDIRTPVTIAVIVLALTQVMNAIFVPYLGHAGLALVGQPGRDDQRRLALRRPAPRQLVPAGAGLGPVRAQDRLRDAGDGRLARARCGECRLASAWPAATACASPCSRPASAARGCVYFGVLLLDGHPAARLLAARLSRRAIRGAVPCRRPLLPRL